MTSRDWNALSLLNLRLRLFTMLTDDEERELPAIQRGLVDICFEEAQYESGIDVLTNLCSSRYKPPPYVLLHSPFNRGTMYKRLLGYTFDSLFIYHCIPLLRLSKPRTLIRTPVTFPTLYLLLTESGYPRMMFGRNHLLERRPWLYFDHMSI